MNTQIRYIFLALAVLLTVHYTLSFTNEGYGSATSFSRLKEQFTGTASTAAGSKSGSTTGSKPGSTSRLAHNASVPDEYYLGNKVSLGRKADAAIVMLARNGDLDGTITSVKQMEDRFNKKFNYPYVFLNEEPFSDEFKSRVSALTDSTVQFGLIPHDHWYQPDWIDETRASAARAKMQKDGVIYGGSLPYRNMCRYNSGFFFRHELLKPYKYYWRVEPHVTFFCDLDFDPFLFMQDNDKVYSFVLSLPEYPATIPTLWDTVKEFTAGNPTLLPPDNAMGFLSDDGGETYNRCHSCRICVRHGKHSLPMLIGTALSMFPMFGTVWSNFEIGSLQFLRGEAYMKFFDHLDERGGFYYERWGDAPVHSIGAALFARRDQIHFFTEIGYRHEPFQRCPQGAAHDRGKCWCDQKDNFDYDWYSCLKKFDGVFSA